MKSLKREFFLMFEIKKIDRSEFIAAGLSTEHIRDEILRATEDATGVAVKQILAEPTGSRAVSMARHVAAYVLIERFGYSVSEVGRMLNCHHTSIMNGRQRVASLIARKPRERDVVSEVVEKSFEALSAIAAKIKAHANKRGGGVVIDRSGPGIPRGTRKFYNLEIFRLREMYRAGRYAHEMAHEIGRVTEQQLEALISDYGWKDRRGALWQGRQGAIQRRHKKAARALKSTGGGNAGFVEAMRVAGHKETDLRTQPLETEDY